jgi:hypothetical protein
MLLASSSASTCSTERLKSKFPDRPVDEKPSAAPSTGSTGTGRCRSHASANFSAGFAIGLVDFVAMSFTPPNPHRTSWCPNSFGHPETTVSQQSVFHNRSLSESWSSVPRRQAAGPSACFGAPSRRSASPESPLPSVFCCRFSVSQVYVDSDPPVRPTDLYYQTDRFKISVWNCGISDIS